MELTPLSNTHIDRRLQDIDRQISSALRDIRKNLEELEQASNQPGDGASATGPAARDKGFADALRNAMDRGGASSG
ncbi:MAG TPA: hypothetical protein QGF95_16130 [Candidatus Latescibacteria bacterium]|jgi:hypothetical protein|nr:hypothetical protein [Candidatus Latescibacterota bacterium]HJP32073.1 hypothetical protein [Candidatus Latescibacterota bacterium]|tara:strand:- start:598 stop:825 length:228 start_codon:yes stop_codon:yes gene_type:complete